MNADENDALTRSKTPIFSVRSHIQNNVKPSKSSERLRPSISNNRGQLSERAVCSPNLADSKIAVSDHSRMSTKFYLLAKRSRDEPYKVNHRNQKSMTNYTTNQSGVQSIRNHSRDFDQHQQTKLDYIIQQNLSLIGQKGPSNDIIPLDSKDTKNILPSNITKNQYQIIHNNLSTDKTKRKIHEGFELMSNSTRREGQTPETQTSTRKLRDILAQEFSKASLAET